MYFFLSRLKDESSATPPDLHHEVGGTETVSHPRPWRALNVLICGLRWAAAEAARP